MADNRGIMSGDIDALIAGLTEAQRKALCWIADQWGLEAYADGRTLLALDRRGLTGRYVSERDFRNVHVTVTALGRQVRARLQEPKA